MGVDVVNFKCFAWCAHTMESGINKTTYWGIQSSSQSWQTPQPCYTVE